MSVDARIHLFCTHECRKLQAHRIAFGWQEGSQREVHWEQGDVMAKAADGGFAKAIDDSVTTELGDGIEHLKQEWTRYSL